MAILAATFAVGAALAGACANGSSTGIRDTPDGDVGDGFDGGNTATIGQPIVSSSNDSGTSILPVTDGGDTEGGDLGTVTLGDDDGGEDGGEGGSGCQAVLPSKLCGLNPQCGCEGTETCDITDTSNGSVSCVPSGNTIQGDLCKATSDCVQGLTCVLGACRPSCFGQALGTPCTESGTGSCAQLYSGSTQITNDKICFVSCDLTNPAAACGANGCVNAGNETNCETVGTGVEFASCTSATSCAPGLGCITIGSGDSGTSTCRNFCKIGGEACDNNESCTHFSTDLVLNGATYGFCE